MCSDYFCDYEKCSDISAQIGIRESRNMGAKKKNMGGKWARKKSAHNFFSEKMGNNNKKKHGRTMGALFSYENPGVQVSPRPRVEAAPYQKCL